VIVRPLQDSVRGQLSAIVADDHLRLAAIGNEPAKRALNGLPNLTSEVIETDLPL
jgi:hypothetical protein